MAVGPFTNYTAPYQLPVVEPMKAFPPPRLPATPPSTATGQLELDSETVLAKFKEPEKVNPPSP
jgi:hypothetical protein